MDRSVIDEVSRQHIVALDGLRGVAAISVALGHFHLGQRAGFFSHAGLAVDFFLFLSGFVISLAYQSKLEQGLSLKDFFIMRIMRLYPMIFVGTIIGISLSNSDNFIMNETNGGSFVLMRVAFFQFFMIPFATPNSSFLLNFVFWSLFWEIFLNALHAVAARWLSKTNVLIIFAAALLGLVSVAAAFDTVFVGFGAGWNFLAGGVRLGFCYVGGIAMFRFRARISAIMPKLPFVIVAAGLFALLALPFKVDHPAEGVLMLALALPIMLALGIVGTDGGFAARALGTLSYPLYAIHAPIVSFVQSHVVVASPLPSLPLRVLTFAGLLFVSYVLGRWVDLALVRWLRARKFANPLRVKNPS